MLKGLNIKISAKLSPATYYSLCKNTLCANDIAIWITCGLLSDGRTRWACRDRLSCAVFCVFICMLSSIELLRLRTNRSAEYMFANPKKKRKHKYKSWYSKFISLNVLLKIERNSPENCIANWCKSIVTRSGCKQTAESPIKVFPHMWVVFTGLNVRYTFSIHHTTVAYAK